MEVFNSSVGMCVDWVAKGSEFESRAYHFCSKTLFLALPLVKSISDDTYDCLCVKSKGKIEKGKKRANITTVLSLQKVIICKGQKGGKLWETKWGNLCIKKKG